MRISLQWLLLGALVSCLLIPSMIGVSFITKDQAAKLRADASASHQRVTEILSLGVEKALWDLAPEGAIPLVKSAMQDERIVSARIVDSGGEVFHEEKIDARRQEPMVKLERDVIKDDKSIGKVTVEFSMAPAEAQIRGTITKTLVTSGIQVALCVILLGLVINSRIVSRIRLIRPQAKLVAQKQLNTAFEWKPTDEIGDLGLSLEETRLSLKKLFDELEIKNRELASINANLEKLVEDRTATIRTILENVSAGFLLADRNLVVQEGFTKSCRQLLASENIAGRHLTEVLQLTDSDRNVFQLGMDQVFEDIFPEEVSLSQIRQRFPIAGKTLSVVGRNVRNSKNEIEKVLFTIVDVTDLEQAERENKKNSAIIRIMQNLSSFQDFISESHERIVSTATALQRGDDSLVRRELHTLKGNSSAFGLDPVAKLIHKVEDETQVMTKHVEMIREAVAGFLDENFELFRIKLGDQPEETYSIQKARLDELEKLVRASAGGAESQNRLLEWVKDSQKLPAKNLLGPVRDYVERFADMRGKQVEFKLVGGDLAVEPIRMRTVLQNLIHLIRNAIDHGIETPEERTDKSPVGSIRVQFSESDRGIEVIVRDDGRGIDPERVWNKALKMGLVKASERSSYSTSKIQELIFADGLSTAEELTETSGRGVGMSALRQSVEEVGGKISIKRALGEGTEFCIVIAREGNAATQVNTKKAA
jgi:signal transduction histidine kinase/HAMP domain-containing protein